MRVCAAVLISLSLCALQGNAQDIPTDTSAALAQEWKSPTTVYCLLALRLYTTGQIAPGSLHLSPAQAERLALALLIAGVPDDKDLYESAATRSDFLDTLATANTENTPAAGLVKLFDTVQKHIDDIYKAPGGKQSLIRVQNAAAVDKPLALSLLLDAYPLNPDGSLNSDALEDFRAAYKANSTELFNLVGKKNPAPAK